MQTKYVFKTIYVESSLAWSGSSPHGGCPYFERERGKRNGVKASGLGLRYGFKVGLGKIQWLVLH